MRDEVSLPSVKLDNNLAVAVVVDLLELANVAYGDNMSVLGCLEEINIYSWKERKQG